MAGDLLSQFRVSTKVGFFRGGVGTEHSLDTGRLRSAIWQAVDELDVRPAVIFLHSPERTLTDLRPDERRDTLVAACNVLVEAAAFGLCDRWGIASWEPAPLLAALRRRVPEPRPNILMVRAGLSVDVATLAAADQLAERFGLEPANRWGMSPFGGSTRDAAWHATDLSPFLVGDQPCTSIQAAFRLAYELPQVSHMTVGADDPDHLRSLVAATRLRVAAGTIERYRRLIARPTTTNAGP